MLRRSAVKRHPMKMIDAHIHFSDRPGFQETAAEAGHVNTPEHLKQEFDRLGFALGIAMGVGDGGRDEGECRPLLPDLAGLEAARQGEQPDFIAFCCGLDSGAITPENTPRALELFEKYLKMPRCVGLKLYTGYQPVYPGDPRHAPFFELAGACGVPVVFHTGDTAGSRGKLKYAHPLTVDDPASDFPGTTFVMAHYGNPWIVDATEVAAKHENVFIDLSGLAVGRFEPEAFCAEYHGYLEHLKTWITYLSDYGKFLYGTDWPLVDPEAYLQLIRRLIPERHHNAVLCENALRVLPKLEKLL